MDCIVVFLRESTWARLKQGLEVFMEDKLYCVTHSNCLYPLLGSAGSRLVPSLSQVPEA